MLSELQRSVWRVRETGRGGRHPDAKEAGCTLPAEAPRRRTEWEEVRNAAGSEKLRRFLWNERMAEKEEGSLGCSC